MADSTPPTSERLPIEQVDTDLLRLNYGGDVPFTPASVISLLCDDVDVLRQLVADLWPVVPNGWRYCLSDEQRDLFERLHERFGTDE